MGTGTDSEVIRASVLRWEDSGGALVVAADDYDRLLADFDALVARAEQADTYREALKRISHRAETHGTTVRDVVDIARAAILVQESSKVTE